MTRGSIARNDKSLQSAIPLRSLRLGYNPSGRSSYGDVGRNQTPQLRAGELVSGQVIRSLVRDVDKAVRLVENNKRRSYAGVERRARHVRQRAIGHREARYAVGSLVSDPHKAA